jgi:wyosine [tRNA(Phe)-imidazoG37] synthetase (radical SAM superfamily)
MIQIKETLKAVEEALQAYRDIDYITFSGKGEATLHPGFPAIVSGVRRTCAALGLSTHSARLRNVRLFHQPGRYFFVQSRHRVLRVA